MDWKNVVDKAVLVLLNLVQFGAIIFIAVMILAGFLK